ncbi:hypothetical protein M9H77_08448 [Catharanthus roseus]|uniref:Uncharacterized protein n=1 Tax=Catharanthus roseus TaxID=4058 RepID=A0ACC0BXT3_CATRO|nr:hypothetical protein M9H77_08448 [Catharanthus roseus]
MKYNWSNPLWKRIEAKSKQEDHQSKCARDMYNSHHGDNGVNAYGGNNHGNGVFISKIYVRVGSFSFYAKSYGHTSYDDYGGYDRDVVVFMIVMKDSSKDEVGKLAYKSIQTINFFPSNSYLSFEIYFKETKLFSLVFMENGYQFYFLNSLGTFRENHNDFVSLNQFMFFVSGQVEFSCDEQNLSNVINSLNTLFENTFGFQFYHLHFKEFLLEDFENRMGVKLFKVNPLAFEKSNLRKESFEQVWKDFVVGYLYYQRPFNEWFLKLFMSFDSFLKNSWALILKQDFEATFFYHVLLKEFFDKMVLKEECRPFFGISELYTFSHLLCEMMNIETHQGYSSMSNAIVKIIEACENKFEGFNDEAKSSKLFISSTISKDYSREQFGCEKEQVCEMLDLRPLPSSIGFCRHSIWNITPYCIR